MKKLLSFIVLAGSLLATFPFFASAATVNLKTEANQNKLWAAWLETGSTLKKTSTGELSYFDPGEVVIHPSDFGSLEQKDIILNDIRLNVTSNGYVYKAKKVFESTGGVTFKLKNNNITYQVGFDFMISGNYLYFKPRVNYVVRLMLQKLLPDLTAADFNKWYKTKFHLTEDTGKGSELDQQLNTLKKYRMIDVKETFPAAKGKFKVTAEINKAKILSYVENEMGMFDGDPAGKEVFNMLLDKWQTKNFTISGNLSPFRVEKVDFNSNFISVINTVQNLVPFLQESLQPVGAKAGAARTLAETRQVVTYLEMYNGDHGGYPETLSGLSTTNPPYITAQNMPVHQTTYPGQCKSTELVYVYTPQGTPQTLNGKKVYPSYTLQYCLAESAGSLPAGVGNYSPEQGFSPTTPPQEDYGITTDESVQAAKDFISKLVFSATLSVKSTTVDVNKRKKISPPKNAKDLTGEVDPSLPLPLTARFFKRVYAVSPLAAPLISGDIAGAATHNK
ncbi:MAG TPA: hypothetical protein VEA59_04205 [Patescibacteria group bacterium]|nr:hypothetical protein [Patescibacteria group bacterium]